MDLAATIELTIARRIDSATTAALRIELPHHRVDPVAGVPITLNDEALRALSLTPDVYGATLTAMVFSAPLREAWHEARGFADGTGKPLQVRLVLEGDDTLHAIYWELLRDPLDSTPLAHNERVRFSRFLPTRRLSALQLPTRPELRAVVAVANPPQLLEGMAPVDVAGEVTRARHGLGDIPAAQLDGSDGRPQATLPAIAAALRDGAHVLYLVCHGDLSEGQPRLWLEQEGEGRYRPVAGDDLVQLVTRQEHRLLLVVLASCQGAGDTHQMLAAIGPRLAQAGVGAVVAMQGNVPMELVAELTPRLFTELQRDGHIDRALAAARAALSADTPWWMPTLWMAVRDGALWQTPQGVPTRGAGVFQVPYPPNPLFRGRDTELVRLAEALLSEQSGTAAVLPAVSGTGGIGKTQLASEFAHRHRDDFPGGVFWLNMADPETVASQVAAAGGPGGLDLPGWSGLDFEAKVAAVRRAWNEPVRRLLVFDNLEDPRLLQEWRPTSGSARVLITTRRGVWGATSGVQPVPLQTLARPESVRLLLTPRYREQVETMLAEPGVAVEADAICEQVGDLPLALALAGAYLEQTPSLSLAGYKARLAETLLAHPSLDAALEEGLPTRHAESVAATIVLSYQQLDPTSKRDELAFLLLQRAAHLAPAPIPQRLLVRLVERDPDDEGQVAEVDAPLLRLAAIGLIDPLPDGSVAIHRLVAAFVCKQGTKHNVIQVVAKELISETEVIYAAGFPLNCAPYLPHLTHLSEMAKELEAKQQAILQSILGDLLRDQGNYAASRPHYERALVIHKQVSGSAHPDTAKILYSLGVLLHNQGDYVAAHRLYEHVLVICEQALGPNHPFTAKGLNSLGILLHDQGDYAAARPYYERALTIREQALGSTHLDTAKSFNNIATLLHNQGDYVAARPYYERALTILEQTLGLSHPLTAEILYNLGQLLHNQGDYAAARPLLEQALAVLERTLGSVHPYTAAGLSNLGILLSNERDYAAARSLLQRALAIYEQTFGLAHPKTLAVKEKIAAIYTL